MNRPIKILLILGLIFTIAPIFMGFLITVISMIFAFHDLSQRGIADPHQLASHIGLSLMATVIGLAFSAFGLLLLVVAGLMYAFMRPPGNPISN
jgi:biopolymer transport protein ExbB/TolQ